MDFDNLEKNFHKKFGNLILTDYQVEVLEKYNINYNDFNNLNELIYYLEDYLNNGSNEELELISDELAEFNYYNCTNK